MAFSPPSSPDSKLYEISPSVIAGEGLFATSSIPKSTIIISKPPILVIPPLPVSHDPSLNNHSIIDAYSLFSPASKEQFLHLHPSSETDELSIIDRFEKNRFDCDELAGMTEADDPDVSGVFLVTSKINHCCAPNVDWEIRGEKGEVVALRDIEKDEELLLDYVTDVKAWDTRKRKLKRGWGIVCNCRPCLEDEEKRQRWEREEGEEEKRQTWEDEEHESEMEAEERTRAEAEEDS